MSILNEYFSQIHCINLDRREDRWDESQSNFLKHGITVNRFSAFDGKTIDIGHGPVYNAELATAMSHNRLLNHAITNNLDNILILEDDVEFIDGFQERSKQLLSDLPDDWDILFFGGNHTGGYSILTSTLGRVYHTYALHCYAINKKAYNIIYNNISNAIGNVLSTPYKLEPSIGVDFYQAKLHRVLNVYSAIPNLAWQRESFSDIQLGVVYYPFLK